MSNKKVSQWWRSLIIVFLGVVIFVGLIPSCTAISSSKFDALVDNNRESIISETESFEEIIANLPTAEEIRAMPIAPHPRLLATEARFAEIKQQIKTDETMKEWYEILERKGKRLLESKFPQYKFKNANQIQDYTRRTHDRVITLSFLYIINPEQGYIDRIWKELNIVGNFKDWNPAHFLTTAEITYAFAIAYDWLYDDWQDAQREFLRSSILEKSLKPALYQYETEEWWTTAENNWNQVCNSNVAMGALVVLDDYPEIASEALHQTLTRLPKAMQHYAPDGGWNEGLSYWNYGTFYNTLALASLDSAFYTDFDLSKIEGFSQTGFFPIYMSGNHRVPFNFADAGEEPFRSSQLLWMANRFDCPIFFDYQQRIAAPKAVDLIWYRLPLAKKSLHKLPLDRYFEGIEVVSMRSEWNNPQGLFVGFKAGDNKAHHSNLDLGTFVLDALGVRWATELGADSYSLPGYFDKRDRRWTYYRMRAEGQNTLAIAPDGDPDQNPNAETKIIHFSSQPHKAYAIADLTSAYSPKVKQIRRKITLDRSRQQIYIEDEIKADKPVDVWWFMHTEADIKLGANSKIAMLSQDEVQLQAKLPSNRNYQFEIMNAKPLPTSPNPPGQEQNTGIKKLAIHLQNVTSSKLPVVFTPLSKQN